jgi:hypothetical protein
MEDPKREYSCRSQACVEDVGLSFETISMSTEDTGSKESRSEISNFVPGYRSNAA